MTNILFVGQKPETVDFSDPSLPPGFNAEKINAGIALGVKKIEEHGWKSDTCMITPDAAGSAMLLEVWDGDMTTFVRGEAEMAKKAEPNTKVTAPFMWLFRRDALGGRFSR